MVLCLVAASFLAGYSVRYLNQQLYKDSLLRERVPDTSGSTLYRERTSQFRLLENGPTTVLIGDSITGNGNWGEWLGPTVGNRAVNGDTSLGVLKRLDVSVPSSADTVFLMIGLNDLKNFHVRPDRVAGYTARIVQGLKGRRVYLQSVVYTDRPELNQNIRTLNALNRRLCDTGACTYIDLNPLLAPDGSLTEAMSFDGRHLNGRGYQVWSDRIRPLIAGPANAGARAGRRP